MSEYYTVFDMTPYDEYDKDYIRIGIAKANPYDAIGKDLLDKAKRYHESSARTAFWIIIMFVILIVVGAYACIKHQSDSELSIDFNYKGLNPDGLSEDKDKEDIVPPIRGVAINTSNSVSINTNPYNQVFNKVHSSNNSQKYLNEY